VALGARFSSYGLFVFDMGVTALAFWVVGREPRLERRMRRVAGQAAQLCPRFLETTARCEHQRLMPGIPGIMKIGGVTGGGHSVASAAKVIQVSCRKLLRVRQAILHWISRMRSSGPVTGFTTDSQLMRQDGPIFLNRKRPGGVAGEATQNRSGRIKDTVQDAARVAMSGCQRKAIDFPVPALAQF